MATFADQMKDLLSGLEKGTEAQEQETGEEQQILDFESPDKEGFEEETISEVEVTKEVNELEMKESVAITEQSSDKIENLCRRLSEKKDLQTALRLAYYVEWVTCEWLAHLDGKDLRREPVQQLCQTVKQCVLDFYGLPHTERTKKFHSGLCTPLLSLQQRYLDPLVIPYWQDRDRGFSYLLSGILGTLPAEYSADLSAPYVSAAPQPAAAAAPPYVPQ
jgi:hypothetical protein